MKKFLLMAAVVLMGAVSANAQYKPEAMTVTAELNYSPSISVTNQNGDFSLNRGFQLPEYGAKFRLFLNENMAVRLKLGFSTNSTNEITYYDDTNNKEQERYDKTNITEFSFMPGFEYHFSKYERVSPYVGAEIGFLTGSYMTKTGENTENDDYTKIRTPYMGFALNAVTGFDVYLCKGLYMGAELGLGYKYAASKRSHTTDVSSSQTTEIDGPSAMRENFFGFYATPSLRVGWCF